MKFRLSAMAVGVVGPMLGLALGLAGAPGCVVSEEQGVAPIVGCHQDTDCLYGYYCQEGGCQDSPRTCTFNADCVLGETCQPNPAPGCSEPDSGLDCPAASLCLPPDVGFCCPCQTDDDCASGGYCLVLSLGNLCSASCDPLGCVSGNCCPDGGTCGSIAGPDGGTLETCLPNDGVCPTSGLSCD